MTDTLTVQFDGLNAFVPMSKSRWIAALPDLRKSFDKFLPAHFGLPAGKPAPVLAPHVPCLIVPEESVKDLWSNRIPNLVFQAKHKDDQNYHLYALDGEKVAVLDSASLELSVHLGLVAPLGDLVSDAGTFNAQLLDGELPSENGANGARLAGTVVIDGGELAGGKAVTWGGTKVPIDYEFRPSSHVQHQADFVFWRREIERSSLILEFHRRGSTASELRLRPIDGAYRFEVINLELETILKLGSSFRPPDKHDKDSAIFYVLSKAWPKLAQTPLPLAHVPDSPPDGLDAHGGHGGEFCKPIKYSGLG